MARSLIEPAKRRPAKKRTEEGELLLARGVSPELEVGGERRRGR